MFLSHIDISLSPSQISKCILVQGFKKIKYFDCFSFLVFFSFFKLSLLLIT